MTIKHINQDNKNMNTELQTKIDTLIADHNAKTDALDEIVKKMQELDGERRKLQDEILFVRGQITALTSLNADGSEAIETSEVVEDTKPVTAKVTGASSKTEKKGS